MGKSIFLGQLDHKKVPCSVKLSLFMSDIVMMSFRYACSIKLEYEVIVTGGFDGTYLTRQTVSVYTEEGWVQDLASLRHGRYNHACAHYTSDNDLVKLSIMI